MAIKTVFVNGVETIFKILKDAVKQGQYIIETNDGWGNKSEDSDDVRIILDKLKQADVEQTSFYDLIQPTDVIGLVPGADLSYEMASSNFIVIGERKFTIVAFDTDAYEVLFTLLLRDT